MVSVSLILRDEWYPIVAAVSAIVDALLGFLKELGFRRLLVPAGPEERTVTFFQLAPLIHHAGYIGLRGDHLVDLAVAPRMPCSLAWGVALYVMTRWSAEARGRGAHPFVGLGKGQRDLPPGAGGGVGAGPALGPA